MQSGKDMPDTSSLLGSKEHQECGSLNTESRLASDSKFTDTTSATLNANASSPCSDADNTAEDHLSASPAIGISKSANHFEQCPNHQQQNARDNTKCCEPVVGAPAFWCCMQNILGPSHLMESKLRKTFENEDLPSLSTSPLGQENSSNGREDGSPFFRKGSFITSYPQAALEARYSADAFRTLIEEVDFSQAFSEPGALDELTMEALQHCFPDGAGTALDREYIGELLDWQKMPKKLAARARQATGGTGTSTALSGARDTPWHMDGNRGANLPGKILTSGGVANQKANNSKETNSLLCYPADEMLSGDQPLQFDGRMLSVPNVDIAHIRQKLGPTILEEICQEIREQAEEAISGSISNSSSKAAGSLTSCDDLLLMHCIREAFETVGSQLLNYDEKKRSSKSELSERSGDGGEVSTGGSFIERLQELKNDRLEGLCRHLSLSSTTRNGVYGAVSGTAFLLLFNTLSLSTLKKCCKELGINTSEDPSTDAHLLPESLAEKISSYFYPPSDHQERLSLSHIHFLPHLQVHEISGPSSSFTCSLNNAQIIGQLPLERYISNRFSCQKVKWRCMMVAKRGFLHLYLWHRHSSPIFAQILIRPSEDRKKKKKRSNGVAEKEPKKQETKGTAGITDVDGKDGSPDHLCLNTSAVAEPNELVEISNLFPISHIFPNSSSGADAHFYQASEDRISFQLTLQTSDGPGQKKNSPVVDKKLPSTAKSAMGKDGVEPAGTVVKTTTESSGKEAEKPDDDRRQRALLVALSNFTGEENKGRDGVHNDWHAGYRQMQYAEYREAMQARQAAKERERKLRLLKAGPSSELQREVEKYRQLVQTSQQIVAKLSKEKSVEEKECNRLKEKVEETKAEMENLRALHESKTEEVAQLEEEARIVQQRIAEKRSRAELRRQRREQALWQDHLKSEEALPSSVITNANDALSINDLGLFLTNGVCGGGSSSGSSSEPIFHTSLHPVLPLIDVNFPFISSGNVGSSLDLIGNGANTISGVGVSPSTPPPNHVVAPPVFSTQPHLHAFSTGDDLSVAVECSTSLHISPSPNQLAGMHTTPPLSSSPLMFNVGGGQTSTGLGSTVHGGEPSAGNLASIGAFGAIGGPSPFSTNPATHHSSMYAQLDTSPPAFHTNSDVLGDHALGTSLGLVQPVGGGASPHRLSNSQSTELNPFTVTAGGASTSLGVPFTAFTPDPNSVLFGPPSESCTPPAGSLAPLFYKTELPNVEPFSTSAW